MAISPERLTSRQEARLHAKQQERLDLIERRKSKKRRMKKLPRTRRLLRQWHARCAGFAGCDAPRVVFPLVGDGHPMLGITAGMDQKDSIPRLWCALRRLRQWHVQGWFCRLCSSRCVLSSVVKPKTLDTLAHMDQRDSYAALVVTAVVCAWLVFLVTMLSRCVLFDCRPVCATTGLVVQTVQMYVLVQFLNKVGDLPVVGPHGPYSAGARGASTGAVLGRGYGHYDRCCGPDSVNCLEVPQFRSCSSPMVVDIPVFTQSMIPMVLIVQKTIEMPQLLVDTVADVPVVRVVQVR